MTKLSKKDQKTFFDVMKACLEAALGPGKAYDGDTELNPVPVGRRSVEWHNISTKWVPSIRDISLSENRHAYFWIHVRFHDHFDDRMHRRFGTGLERRDGATYGCLKWNPSCYGNQHPLVAAHVILKQLADALPLEAADKIAAEYLRQAARRKQPLESF